MYINTYIYIFPSETTRFPLGIKGIFKNAKKIKKKKSFQTVCHVLLETADPISNLNDASY